MSDDDVMSKVRDALPRLSSGARQPYLAALEAAMDMAADDPERAVLSLRHALSSAERWRHDVLQRRMSESGGTRRG